MTKNGVQTLTITNAAQVKAQMNAEYEMKHSQATGNFTRTEVQVTTQIPVYEDREADRV